MIKKIHKRGTEADPLRGRIESTVDGKRTVVEYEPDTELRDTEQIPLLEEGGIEAFLEREVLPYAPDAWYQADSVKVATRSASTVLLQTCTDANPCGDPRGHSRARERDGRAPGRNPEHVGNDR